jgi:hypothetical protein
MLDQESMQIARDRLHAESFKHQHFFNLELQRVQNDLAIKGLGHSGALIQAVADVCAKEIECASERLWEIVRELLQNQEIKDVPTNEAVRRLLSQIDELWTYYCSSEPERQFWAICQRDGVGRSVIDATNFTSCQIGTRLRLQAEAKQFLRSLRKREPVTVWAYWRSVLLQALNESDFKQPWKILSGIGVTATSLLIQYFFGVQSWHFTALCFVSGLVAYLSINIVSFIGKIISIPPQRSA